MLHESQKSLYNSESAYYLSTSSSLHPESSKKVFFEDPIDKKFEVQLQWARLRFECTFNLIIFEDRNQDFHEFFKRKSVIHRPIKAMDRPNRNMSTSVIYQNNISESATTLAVGGNIDTVFLHTFHDKLNRLVEIAIEKQNVVPRQLLQIIGLVGKRFRHLTKINLKCCYLNKYTIPEMVLMLDSAIITELSFDGSVLCEGNYAMLLDKPSNLRVLSLARCKINDLICEQIFKKLNFFEITSYSLLVLNLSMNLITDEGAKHIAFSLRTNRTLRHLNLAGNQISDEGANKIFEILMLFPLTYEECIAGRMRYSNNLKNREEIAKEDACSFNSSKARVSGEIWLDPYMAWSTIMKNGYRHCTGNMVLTSLNLSYNNLSYPSLKKLEAVVKYQSTQRQIDRVGLLRPVIEGNKLPVNSVEYQVIMQILDKFIKTTLNSQKRRYGRRVTKSAGFDL